MSRPLRARGAAPPVGRGGDGLLLLAGSVGGVAAWSARGLVPVHVGSAGRWTAVLPAGPSLAQPPYDDAVAVLAARPVPSRLRPAIGLYAVAGRAIVTLHPSGWRAVPRYAVWSPGSGVDTSVSLRLARPRDLVAAAGVRDGTSPVRVRALLKDGAGEPVPLLQDLADELGLPVRGLLDHSTSPVELGDHHVVTPTAGAVRRFDETVAAEARQRAELEGRL